MEHDREQIKKALGMCIASRPKCKECPYFIGDIKCKHSKLLKDALALIKELTEESANLHASCTEFERKCVSLNDENERLRGELEKRPPRLVITKLEKGNNDENSKDTVALQEREADHYI